ncbi:MAG: hypothetical protein JWQ20_4564 [Conexibacter sp.]|nr:hypothetical protein [Conexibacter sp.]
MFYKSSGRSTVLERIESQRNDHHNGSEDGVVDAPGFAAEFARARAEREAAAAQGKPKLSAFEQELLQAWAQD